MENDYTEEEFEERKRSTNNEIARQWIEEAQAQMRAYRQQKGSAILGFGEEDEIGDKSAGSGSG